MADEAKQLYPLPGTEVVGRGIYIKPYQPYVLKGYLFEREDKDKNVFYSSDTGTSYSVPGGYAVNDSPPMPTDRMLNQTVIEESQEHFDKQMGFDASVAASVGAFSIDAQSSQSKHLRSEEDAYYALRTSFIPLWEVYLPDLSGLSAALDAELTDEEFEHENRGKYERFFARHGTHYVRRAWVGGKATLAFIVAKSSGLSKEGIQAGIKASYTGIGSGNLKTQLDEEKENLQKNSECQIFGKGGDEIQLASLSSLDESAYQEWVETIKNIPQVIELDVVGIWTLLPEEKARVLQNAYRAETVFRRISAIFSYKEKIFIVRGNSFFWYDIKTGRCVNPRLITEHFKVLKDTPFERVDAALQARGLSSPTGDKLDEKVFIFKEKECMRIDYERSQKDEGYPKKIVEDWPGVTFDRIDAAINCGADAIYFFSGNQYMRFNMDKHQVDEGYPKKIAEGWPGVTFDRIDAALYWAEGKVYFFREDEYIRFDMSLYKADPGYPKPVVGEYVEDWKFFD